MNAPLCLVESEDVQRAEEDQIIEEASLILDRRMFTRGPMLFSPQDVRDFLKLKLASHEHEVFASVFLDNRHQVIAFEELFFGTVDGASVYPRQLVKRALHWNCAALIISHNHPSGCSEPSQADRLLTERLKEALALVDVRVLDHFIVGAGRPLSLAEYGWL
jgi:DNA repair protein RadC